MPRFGGLRPIAALVAALSVTTTGCFTSHVRTSLSDAEDVQAARAFKAASIFRYEKAVVPFTNHTVGMGATSMYELRRLELPSIGDNGQKNGLITAKYYRSVLPGPHPLLIVLPIWGTYTYPPRTVSSFIQRHSRGKVHVFYIQGKHYLADWAGIVSAKSDGRFFELWRVAAERMRVTVVDTRRVIDWAEQQPEIDGDRVALIGFSLSACVAGIIATQEARLKATVLLMGGSHPHSLVARCDGKRARSVQAKVATQFLWSPEELEARLQPIFDDLDSANYPNRVDPRRVLVIEAGRDDCVPREARDDMWEALGRPERITLDYDHAPAFFSMSPVGRKWLSQQIWEFLESRLLDS